MKNIPFNHLPSLQQEVQVNNDLYRFDLYLTSSFTELNNHHIKQVSGLVLNSQNQLLLVAKADQEWMLPGGGMEEGENFIDTLKREVYEESAIVVDENFIEPFFFQEVYHYQQGWQYRETQVRFLTKIAKQDKFIVDPDYGDVKHQLFVDLKDLTQYLKWGKSTEFLQTELAKVLYK